MNRYVAFAPTRARVALLAVAAWLGVACQGADGTGPNGSPDDATTLTASIVASDASAPAAPAGMPAGTNVTLEGSVTATGLTVELWNGEQWLTAVDQMATATFVVGDATAETTLMPASEIPGGTYTRVRLTADAAQLDLTVGAQGQQFSASVATPPGQSLTLDKEITVTEHGDGSRTFRFSFVTVGGLSLRNDANGVSLVVTGDFGNVVLPRASVTTSIAASDASAPAPSVLDDLEGTVTMEGVTIELWNGELWLTVVDGMATASFTVGDGSAEVTLMPATDIPAGTYSQVRLTASHAMVQLSVTVDGRTFEATAISGPDQSVVITKEIEVVEHADGSRTFRFSLETVRHVSVGPDDVVIQGDFGSHVLR